jgi:hypothetical protein
MATEEAINWDDPLIIAEPDFHVTNVIPQTDTTLAL